jgi:hypothetical protein
LLELFIINGAGLIFSLEESNFFAKEWTKTVKDLHFGISRRNIFLFLKRKNVFLEKKKNIQQSKRFKNLNYSQLLDNNLKFHSIYVLKYKKGVKK